jgi:stearoyl-CoA desaturase (delta-9 desaturase)
MNNYPAVPPLMSAALMYAIGGMPWLVWGFFVRTVFVLHTTWLVNSATHIWGYRTHATRDKSTNLWWVAALTYGEGWHNNHHAFQTSARHGLRWWEVDMTYMAIRALEICGLATSVKVPKAPRGQAITESPDAPAEDSAKTRRADRKKAKKRRSDGEPELVGSAK